MTKIEKADFILKSLNKLYPNPGIPLQFKDPFTLMVAVILSAQCKDERVNTITPILFKKADTPKKMIKLGRENILKIIKPCGLGPAKSKGIFESSRLIIEKFAGVVPRTLDELETLPSVGHKTASVVMIQAFNTPAFPVDTHIHRLLYRWGISTGKSVTQTERDAKKVFAKDTWIKLHLQIIYFGREYCPARGHVPAECPICRVIGRRSMNR